MNKPGTMKLILEDGSQFSAQSFGYPISTAGEIVFNTAMTGYPESLTDPSFKGQILVSTYPMIGNYGVSEVIEKDGLIQNFESEKVQVSGLVIADYSLHYSHWSATKSLGTWLHEHHIPGMYGVDTRCIAKILREKGCMLAKMVYEDTAVEWYDPNSFNLVDQVSTKEKKVYGSGQNRILLIDCGVKYNILRCLLKRDTTIIRVPWDYDFSAESYDGVFISNGPGDPKMCQATIRNLAAVLRADKPVFGICLGTQLMALAIGANTYKLKYGHRGHNQPVLKVGTNRCYITSQNHGFAVDGATLPAGWEILFVNVNDQTAEGTRHVSKPFFSTQFHPEASGGPTDTEFLFDEFINCIIRQKNK
ncbi:MAG: glutamine-hydrolyzing carbamoyl-phosphate synthase small subunit [Chitinivibrionales bacterium]|nr:glutamine-hydrolyzing carbamoyl-phosphate synthase small subunit [Chitinivibrionales bacterium]